MSGRCKDCEHWLRFYEPTEGLNPGDAVTLPRGFHDHEIPTGPGYRGYCEKTVAFFSDSRDPVSDAVALNTDDTGVTFLATRWDFGCTQFEEKS